MYLDFNKMVELILPKTKNKTEERDNWITIILWPFFLHIYKLIPKACNSYINVVLSVKSNKKCWGIREWILLTILIR